MKVSLKVEYACRVLAQLGRQYDNPELSHIDELASAEEIPANYLVQILNELRNGGIIVSRRGKQGGYALARSPREITLYDIVRVIDGEFLECHFSEKGMSGRDVGRIWTNILGFMEQQLREIPLTEMMVGENEKMYYI